MSVFAFAPGAPGKEVRKLLKKIAPDLKRLLEVVEASDDDDDESVVEESIRSGARSLLIARRIIKENKE